MKPLYLESEACRYWANAWRERRLRTGLEANLRRAGIPEEAFWSRYAAWTDALRNDGYPGVLLERVLSYIGTDSTVLDIGAGTGTFSLPLARVAKRVTAVEPSPSQADHLRRVTTRHGEANIQIIEQRWEDIDLDLLGHHNIVLAAHSLQMDALPEALVRMCRATSERLVLIHTAGHNLVDVLRTMFDIEPGPDYLYPYHILDALGYHPRVELVTRECEVPLDLQLDVFRYNPGLNAEQCNALRSHVHSQGMVTERNGEPRLSRSYTDALISVIP